MSRIVALSNAALKGETPCLRLSGVDGSDAAPDDLCHISARVDAEGEHAGLKAAVEQDCVGDQELYDDGRAADDRGVYLADKIKNQI